MGRATRWTRWTLRSRRYALGRQLEPPNLELRSPKTGAPPSRSPGVDLLRTASGPSMIAVAPASAPRSGATSASAIASPVTSDRQPLARPSESTHVVALYVGKQKTTTTRAGSGVCMPPGSCDQRIAEPGSFRTTRSSRTWSPANSSINAAQLAVQWTSSPSTIIGPHPQGGRSSRGMPYCSAADATQASATAAQRSSTHLSTWRKSNARSSTRSSAHPSWRG